MGEVEGEVEHIEALEVFDEVVEDIEHLDDESLFDMVIDQLDIEVDERSERVEMYNVLEWIEEMVDYEYILIYLELINVMLDDDEVVLDIVMGVLVDFDVIDDEMVEISVVPDVMRQDVEDDDDEHRHHREVY